MWRLAKETCSRTGVPRPKRTPPPSTLRKRTRCRLRRRRPLRTGGRLGSTAQPTPRPSPDTNLAHLNLSLFLSSCISPYLRLQIDTNRRPTPNHLSQYFDSLQLYLTSLLVFNSHVLHHLVDR